MPRLARKKSATGIYHIIMRGVNRKTIFEDDEDKIRLLETLVRYKTNCRYEIYGYCLMDNHIHLLIKEFDEPISNAIKRISSSYVYWYNKKYKRCGHLFQERFKSENVETGTYLLTVLRYIHQNPVKAGLSQHIFDCKWTSFKEYLEVPLIVETNFILEFFSSERIKAVEDFVKFMQLSNDDKCLDITVDNRKTDQEVKEYLRSLGITSNSIQHMDKKKRDAIIIQLKEIEGVSIRQISRITGISSSVIQRLGK